MHVEALLQLRSVNPIVKLSAKFSENIRII